MIQVGGANVVCRCFADPILDCQRPRIAQRQTRSAPGFALNTSEALDSAKILNLQSTKPWLSRYEGLSQPEEQIGLGSNWISQSPVDPLTNTRNLQTRSLPALGDMK